MFLLKSKRRWTKLYRLLGCGVNFDGGVCAEGHDSLREPKIVPGTLDASVCGEILASGWLTPALMDKHFGSWFWPGTGVVLLWLSTAHAVPK